MINIISLTFLAYVLLDFRYNHVFKGWQLRIVRYWHGTLLNCFILPNMQFAFSSTAYYAISSSFGSFIVMFLGIASAVTTIALIFRFFILLNESPFLFRLPFVLWRSRPYFRIIFSYSLPIGICGLFPTETDHWLYILPALILICVAFYGFYEFSFFPFSGQWANTFGASIGAAVIVSALLVIVRAAGGEISIWVTIFMPYAFLLIGILVIGVPFSERRTTILNNLQAPSNSVEGEANELIRQTHLESLKIDNPKLACCYLQLGLEGGCDLFLDGSCARFLFQHFAEDESVMVFTALIVTLFPHEVNIRPLLLSPGILKLSGITNRGLFYQVHRVHLFRQSATSRRVMDDFTKVKERSDAAVAAYSQFWRSLAKPNATIEAAADALPKLTRTRVAVEVAWAHLSDKYPNNPSVFHGYSSFLVEVPCNFPAAIRRHKRAELIEQGVRLPDRVFVCFVRAFPFYLRHGILDSRGKIRTQMATAPTNSTDRVASGSSFDDDSSLDEGIADEVIKPAQLRLAMQQCVSGMKSPVRMKVAISAAVRLVLTLAFAVTIAIVMQNMFSGEALLFEWLKTVLRVRECLNVAMPLLPIAWANRLHPTSPATVEDWLRRLSSFVDPSTSAQFDLFNLSVTGLQYMDDLSRELYDHAYENGGQAVELAELLAVRSHTPVMCDRSNLTIGFAESFSTIDFMMRQAFIALSALAMEDAMKWSKSFTLCSVVGFTVGVSGALHDITGSISGLYAIQYQRIIDGTFSSSGLADEFERAPATETALMPHRASFDFLIALTPAITLFLLFPPLILSSIGWRKEQEQHAAVLLSFLPADREKAGEKIGQLGVTCTDAEGINAQVVEVGCPIWVPSVLITMLLNTALLIPLVQTTTVTERVTSMLHHYALFDALRSAVARAVEHSFMMVLLNQLPDPVRFWNVSASRQHALHGVEEVVLLYEMLNAGYKEASSALGFDEKLDVVRYGEKCTASFETNWPLEYVRCLSLHLVIALVTDTVTQFVVTYDRMKIPSLETEALAVTFLTRVALGMREISVRYEDLFQDTVAELSLVLWITISAAILLSIIGFVADRHMVSVIDQELETFKSLLLRTPPLAFVDIMFGKVTKTDFVLMTGSQAVFQTSPDAMIALNKDVIIENLNPAASSLFGFTPEQMLGQDLSLLINADVTSNSNLYYTIKLMRTGQSQLVYETDVVGVKDDESGLPLRVVLVGFSANGREADSFALICKDLSAEQRDNEQVEEAKKETERLLHALIPQEMLTRIANHDPRFTVPVASVLVINIVHFRGYIGMATQAVLPTVFANLKLLFGSFDALLEDFQTLGKVQIFGDIYIVAAGLFAADGDVMVYAHDLAHFALRCFEKTEEVNVQLTTNFQLRMGVHTGGPLTVGVVDDRNLFTVVGGVLRTAQLLEQRAISGTVNVSSATYDCVSNGPFHIEKHEDVECGEEGVLSTYTLTLGPRVSRQGSKRSKGGFGLGPSMSGHGSMFQVPSLETLVASDRPQPMGDHTLIELITPYDPPSLDFENGS